MENRLQLLLYFTTHILNELQTLKFTHIYCTNKNKSLIQEIPSNHFHLIQARLISFIIRL